MRKSRSRAPPRAAAAPTPQVNAPATPAASTPASTVAAATPSADDVRRALLEPPPEGRDCLRFPTFCKYQVMSRVVLAMNVREKRNVFQHMRDLVLSEAEGTCHTFLPWYGLTLGEFSIFQRR